VYETILLLHLLAAFALVVTAVVYSAFVLGAPVRSAPYTVANRLWDIGGLGTLVFGVWLALDEYEITDAWILAALVMWALAAETGRRASVELAPAVGAVATEGAAPGTGSAARWNWLRVALTVGLLALMIFKPGL
jgi:hypothetical protein